MLERAYNGWEHFCFLALPPFLSLQHFLQKISQIILQFHPQPLDARNSIQWLGTFFLALPPLLDLGQFLQVILNKWMLETASHGWGHFSFFHYHPFWT